MTEWLDIQTLARVKDLPLAAKMLAQGFVHGLHPSSQRGSGIEFSQYRSYEPGDELAKVDWKLFARSDKYFVREAEQESDAKVWFVLDCSRSMMQAPSSLSAEGDAKKAASKFEYSKYLIATLAYIAQRQGDAVGLLTLAGKQVSFLPALAGERHWQKLLIELTNSRSQGAFIRPDDVVKQIAPLQQNGLVIFISDFYQLASEISELVCQLVNKRTNVLALQLTSDVELEFPFNGAVRFQDPETEQQLLVSAHSAKEQYLAQRAQYFKRLTQQFNKRQVDCYSASIDQPLHEVIHSLLQARNKPLSGWLR